jgi:colicin import membrane protein
LSQRRLPEPKIRDEFRRELRARLMREAAVTLVPKRRDTAWTSWLRPAFAVGLAALVLMAGAGSAAAGSLPGDPAFGLKRAIEEVRVALTFDDVQRVRVLAELADQRLSELEQVAGRDDKAPTASDEYAQAVTRFRVAVDALQQAAPADKSEQAQDVADAARDKHEIVLEQLKERLSGRAKDSVERAIEEERRDTTQDTKEKDKRDRQDDQDKQDEDRSGGDGSSPRNSTQSPRATDRTSTPRPTDRAASPRATATPRPSDHD